MPNDQYTITNLEGKVKFAGESRKIKATRTSLNGILSSIPKTETKEEAKGTTLMDRLKEKKAIFHKIGETGKTASTGKKAINVSKSMFETEKENQEIINQENLQEVTFKQEVKEVKSSDNEDTNADTIINALQIFENTNNLTEEENDQKETPAFMQVSGEIKNKDTKEEPSETYEENQPEFGTTHTAEIGKDFGVPSHESSGYLDGINAFKAQIGTDKYENGPARDFTVHTNPEPRVQKNEEQPIRSFTVHTNENPMNVNGSAEHQMNENSSNMSDIDDFVKGYYNLEDLSLGKIRAYKTGCEEYVQQARADKMQAGKEINGLDDQIDAKDEQISKLYAQIKNLEAEKNDLNRSKQDWQNIYSEANTKESLGGSKIDEINQFVYQEFNSMNNQMDNNSSYSNSYSSQGYSGGMEDSGYSRGRRAA